jgi:tetratricopeptide (TPR) repeat protein
MKRDSLAFALSGTAFGLLAGWIIGSQHAQPTPPAPAPQAAAAPAQAPAPPPLDRARVAALEQQAAADPRNVALRLDIANLYFDAEQYEQAAPWYETALAIDPKNANAGTDLAIVYYYSGQVDRALAQIDRALAVDPRHVKALLNQGFIRAAGKQDLRGAAESWEQVVAIAPDSEEGRRARLGLEAFKSAHEAGSVPTGSAPAGSPSP